MDPADMFFFSVFVGCIGVDLLILSLHSMAGRFHIATQLFGGGAFVGFIPRSSCNKVSSGAFYVASFIYLLVSGQRDCWRETKKSIEQTPRFIQSITYSHLLYLTMNQRIGSTVLSVQKQEKWSNGTGLLDIFLDHFSKKRRSDI
jgi:hypothetical protein